MFKHFIGVEWMNERMAPIEKMLECILIKTNSELTQAWGQNQWESLIASPNNTCKGTAIK